MLLERLGDDVADERTAEEDERDGDVVLTLVRFGFVRVVVLTLLRVVDILREVVVVVRPVASCVRAERVAFSVELLRVVVPGTEPRVVVVVLRTLELPYVVLRVVCTPREVEVVLTRVEGDVLLTAVASRIAVRRPCSNARALLTLRDALRVTNERSGCR